MRAGVCFHRGSSYESKLLWDSLVGAEVEKEHAEVSKARLAGWGTRNDDEAPDTNVRRERFDAIGDGRWGALDDGTVRGRPTANEGPCHGTEVS